MTPLATARCAVHHEAPAVVVCTRCGVFACEACVVLTRAPLVCRACAPWLDVLPSARATWSVWLTGYGCLGLFMGCVPPFNVVVVPTALVAGPVGLVLALLERGAIKRGEASAAGARAVRAATILGVLQLVVVAIAIAAAFWLRSQVGMQPLSARASPRPSSVLCR